MFKKIFAFLCLLFVLNSTNIFSIEEIQTIEDYSKQFLNEEILNENIKNNQIKKDGLEEIIEIDNQSSIEEEVENPNEINDATDIEYQNDNLSIDEINDQLPKVNWILKNNFRAALIGDTKGNIIFSTNANKFFPLASVTKVMTLMVTFDEINKGNISLNSKVKITKDIARIGGSRIPMKVGETFLLKDLIKASAIYSANNATYAIAKFVGKGKVSNFVKKMNNKVKQLGLEGELKYYTPAGLPSRMTKQPMDVGTAKGIYKLSIEALKYKKYIEIASIEQTKIHNNKITIKNRNHLLGKEGIFGIKTGYHKEAKYNITIASDKNDMKMITVVLGGNSYTQRDQTVLDILTIFNKNYQNKQILDKNVAIAKFTPINSDKVVDAWPDKNFSLVSQKGKEYKIECEMRENLKLNIFVGEKIGKYKVLDGDKIVTSGNLISRVKVIN